MISTEPFFEVMLTNDKGFGTFAARDIPRGTRVIEEVPLLVVSSCDSDDLDLSEFETALRALTPEQHGKFSALYRDHDDPVARRIVNEQAQVLKSSQSAEIIDALAIFLANNVAMGKGGSGVFEHYSRINHDCNPNVNNVWNSTIEKLTVHAVRQINKGEEITTSYVDSTCRTRQQRQKELDNWDFVCSCKCCTGPNATASERRRKRMFTMDQELESYASVSSGSSVPRNAQAALSVAEDLLEL